MQTFNVYPTPRPHPSFTRPLFLRRTFLWLSLVFLVLPNAWSHVGNPIALFESNAGPYRVRVFVRPPGVVPGLAEIQIRVLSGSPTQVTVLPLHWRAGKKGAPAPDVAQPVPGQSNLYSAELWLMTQGAYSVGVELKGPQGNGEWTVPVNSVAEARLPLSGFLKGLLVALGLVLVASMIAIQAAAIRESRLAPDATPTRRNRIQGLFAGVLATSVLGGAVAGGTRWWNTVDAHHNSKIVYRPIANSVALETVQNIPHLQFQITDSNGSDHTLAPLIPEHGHLMHLFLIGGPNDTVLAHLHPLPENERIFRSPMPNLPPGRYRVFAEITEETGQTHTLTNHIDWLPSPASSSPTASPTPAIATNSDAWGPQPKSPQSPSTLNVSLHGLQSVQANSPITLTFQVNTLQGQPAPLSPYLGMMGHVVVYKTDGSVFTHLHPSGSVSMAALKRFADQNGLANGAWSQDPNCGELDRLPLSTIEALGRTGSFATPCVFPTPGQYRIWCQFKSAGVIHTHTFEVEVASPNTQSKL